MEKKLNYKQLNFGSIPFKETAIWEIYYDTISNGFILKVVNKKTKHESFYFISDLDGFISQIKEKEKEGSDDDIEKDNPILQKFLDSSYS